MEPEEDEESESGCPTATGQPGKWKNSLALGPPREIINLIIARRNLHPSAGRRSFAVTLPTPRPSSHGTPFCEPVVLRSISPGRPENIFEFVATLVHYCSVKCPPLLKPPRPLRRAFQPRACAKMVSFCRGLFFDLR